MEVFIMRLFSKEEIFFDYFDELAEKN